MNKKSLMNSAVAIGAGAILAIALPLAASAHISVNPSAAAAGSYTVLTFTVPTESETEATSRIEVTLPVETPFASVRYVPLTGWTTELVKQTLPKPVMVSDREITEAVTKVIWTALPGSEIVAGQLQLFSLSVGPVPDTGFIALKAEQTYTDGEVVSWSDEGENAEYPAPILYINDVPAEDHHGGATVAATAVHEEAEAPANSADVLARILGIAGLVVGAIGLVFGVTARSKIA